MAEHSPQCQEQQQQLALPRPSTPTGNPIVPFMPRITNIVAGIDLNCRLDHQHISNAGRWGIDNTSLARGRKGSRFPAAVIRERDPRSTALIFNSGKMQILGTRAVADTHLAARKFARKLEKMGYKPKLGKLNVQNIVANVDTKMLIRLEGLVKEHYLYARYEPEIFPGLVYGMVEPKVTFLVFARGKVVILGAKRVEELEEAWAKLYPVLLGFKQV